MNKEGSFKISDKSIKVEFNSITASLKVTDIKAGIEWRQEASREKFHVTGLEDGEIGKIVHLNGKFELDMEIGISPSSDLVIVLSAKDNQELTGNLYFPGPFTMSQRGCSLVMPVSEGILLPVEDTSFPLTGVLDIYDMSGLIMPWAGVVDENLKQGYMVIAATPDDCGVDISRRMLEVMWKPSMGRFRYSRKLVYHFFTDGGYVAQCKYYRDYVIASGSFRTLKEKACRNPDIDLLVGAVHIYIWADGRGRELAEELHKAGIEKAWMCWDPSHPPYPPYGYCTRLKELGYLAGVYDLYRDICDDGILGKKLSTDPICKGMYLHRYYYPGLFPRVVARNKDLSLKSFAVGNDTGLSRYWTCTKAMLDHMGERIGRELLVYQYNSIFIDVILAAGLIECYDNGHPMTASDDKEARLTMLRYFSECLGMIVGSEWGADYGLQYTDLVHGVMTLNRFMTGWGNRGEPTFLGDWKNLERPSIMLTASEPSELYMKYGLGEYYRVPLYQLVYHDSTVSSWRWEDNNHKLPKVWDTKDLFNILYGTAPQWNLDMETWKRDSKKFIESYKKIGPWLNSIGYDELVDHKFLTEDRLVQETLFSSGRKAVVDFKTKDIQIQM